jgi:hypothetical protein
VRPEILAEILPFAVAALTLTAASPLLLLLTPRGRSSGTAFLGGWTLGLVLSAWILLRIGLEPRLLGTTINEDAIFRPLTTFLVGVTLIVSGLLALRAAGRLAAEPGWMRRVDTISPASAGGLALVLAGLSPKLLLLTAAAVVTLIAVGATGTLGALGIGLYVLIASLPIALPVVIVLADRERAPQRLATWKAWFLRNQGRIVGGGSIFFGILLVARSIQLAGSAA